MSWISWILKLRNQLLSHRENKIRSKDPNSLEDILRKGFSTGVSYMNWLVGVDESSHIESLEAKGPVVKQLMGFGVGRDEDPEPAVKEEAIDDVGPTWLPNAMEASRRRKGTLSERSWVVAVRPARPHQ
ncbi:hypothetical protein NL676_018385 [Syzygium grande]|nr:hypothetical protein NL676_018385 [Syzygium grande]